jgi:glycogen synthase
VKSHQLPLIHTTRDYFLFHPNCKLYANGKNTPISTFSVKIWSWFKKVQSKHVDGYVGISDFIRDIHIKGGFFKKSSKCTIYNSIDNFKITPVKSSKIRVGFIGRLTEDKGFLDFCEYSTKYSNSKIEFFAAGRFNAVDEFELSKFARESGVTLLGFINLIEFLDNIDVVILPIKWQEPFGRVVVECAAAGKIVYTNRVGGISELFSMYDNIFDINEIEDGFVNMFPDILKDGECKNEYRVKIVENLTIDVISKQYNDFYEMIIKK